MIIFENNNFQDYLLIKMVRFQKKLNLMFIILSNGKVLKNPISESSTLYNASEEQLNSFLLIGNGAGIFWPELDEDFSLDDFLQQGLSK